MLTTDFHGRKVCRCMEDARNNFFDIRQTEQEGFEPPLPFGKTVFKTVALSRSATAPDVTVSALSNPNRFKRTILSNFTTILCRKADFARNFGRIDAYIGIWKNIFKIFYIF